MPCPLNLVLAHIPRYKTITELKLQVKYFVLSRQQFSIVASSFTSFLNQVGENRNDLAGKRTDQFVDQRKPKGELTKLR